MLGSVGVKFKLFSKHGQVAYLTEWFVSVEVYGPVNPMGSCRARSVYLATRLLGRLSPLSG